MRILVGSSPTRVRPGVDHPLRIDTMLQELCRLALEEITEFDRSGDLYTMQDLSNYPSFPRDSGRGRMSLPWFCRYPRCRIAGGLAWRVRLWLE